jgi:hypothetical protein
LEINEMEKIKNGCGECRVGENFKSFISDFRKEKLSQN